MGKNARMSDVITNERDELRFYLSEACDSLGFVSVDAVDWLADFIERYNFDAVHSRALWERPWRELNASASSLAI
jgi:hypothetical protein